MSGLSRGPERSGLGKSLREKTEGTDMLKKKWAEPIGRLESKLWRFSLQISVLFFGGAQQKPGEGRSLDSHTMEGF